MKIFEKELNNKIYNHKVSNEYYKNLLKALQICNGPVHSHSFVGQLINSKEISKKAVELYLGRVDELFGGYDTYRQD